MTTDLDKTHVGGPDQMSVTAKQRRRPRPWARTLAKGARNNTKEFKENIASQFAGSPTARSKVQQRSQSNLMNQLRKQRRERDLNVGKQTFSSFHVPDKAAIASNPSLAYMQSTKHREVKTEANNLMHSLREPKKSTVWMANSQSSISPRISEAHAHQRSPSTKPARTGLYTPKEHAPQSELGSNRSQQFGSAQTPHKSNTTDDEETWRAIKP
eukprot:CAMPEP_0167775268 /NCGR_PEP_ID=MMETSP0111_2-20121227/2458_1 /TAXON_ID=91324 /ORGANISM="Lotharella globosa, Strain CCCM811" /LENGTH=212 /DNA_ID=CAMNT_0007665151 /DNA_START=20 /DNA_END=654 /DNA_ORIENTATION=-